MGIVKRAKCPYYIVVFVRGELPPSAVLFPAPFEGT